MVAAAAEIVNWRIVVSLSFLLNPPWVALILHKNYISLKTNINQKIISIIFS